MTKWLLLMSSLLFTNVIWAADFTLQSTGFTDGKKIPPQFTCNKGDTSPELHWANAPKNTKAFALLAKGLDSPMGEVYGWVLFNIPANVTELPEGINDLPEGTQVAKNALGVTDYRGPCPPDSNLHHYVFTIYALSEKLDVSPDADVRDIADAVKVHSIAQASLKGIFVH